MTNSTEQNARVIDQFTQQADAYAALIRQSRTSRPDPLIEALQPRLTDRILDVGCGSGQFAVGLAPRVEHITGIDLTPSMLDKARAHQAEAGVTNVDWRLGDSTALPVEDAAFDIVVSRSMFHHAADPGATLAEMRRACKGGGRIAVMDLAPSAGKAPAFDAIEFLRDPSHRRVHTPEELRALGRALALTETTVRSHTSDLPLEAVLATSFPPPGMLERVRDLYARDAQAGADSFGMAARLKDGVIWLSYPSTLVVWQR